MNTLHGQPVEVGDEVYSITHGYGKVVNLYSSGNILVEFSSSICSPLVVKITFYQDGRSRPEDISPILYWTKPEITGGMKKRTKVRKAIYVVKTGAKRLTLMDFPCTEDSLKQTWPDLEIICEVPGTEVIEYI